MSAVLAAAAPSTPTPPRRLPEPLCALLAAARASHGWTLRDAGREASCSHEHVRRLELGHRRPRPRLVAALTEAYGLSDDEAAALLEVAWRGAGGQR